MLYNAMDIARKFNLSETAVRNRLKKINAVPSNKDGKHRYYDETVLKSFQDYRPFPVKGADTVQIAVLAKELGISVTTIDRNIKCAGIQRFYISDGAKPPISAIKKEDAEKLKEYRKKLKAKVKEEYYRVSIMVGDRWFVKHVLTLHEAEKKMQEYYDKGLIARILPCREK